MKSKISETFLSWQHPKKVSQNIVLVRGDKQTQQVIVSHSRWLPEGSWRRID